MCRPVWGGLRGSLSLMYSSMHSPGRGVNRVERTLLNFFMWKGMRVGFLGAPRQCFAGDFGAEAGRGWAVLPRNSGVFGLGEGAARRFSARRTLLGSRGEKIFKKGVKNRKIGVREVPEGGVGGTLNRGALHTGASTTSTRCETSRRDIRESLLLYRELYMEHLSASSIAHFMEASPLVRHIFL